MSTTTLNEWQKQPWAITLIHSNKVYNSSDVDKQHDQILWLVNGHKKQSISMATVTGNDGDDIWQELQIITLATWGAGQ